MSATPATRIAIVSPRGETFADTIDEGLAEARLQRQAGETGVITLRLPPRTFRVEQPIELGAKDSGLPSGPLVIEGDPSGGTIVSGAVPLDDGATWERCTPPNSPSNAICLHLVASNQPIDLTIAPRRYDNVRASSFDLYQGSRALRPARWPATGFSKAFRVTRDADTGPYRIHPPTGTITGPEPAPIVAGYWSRDWSYESVVAEPHTGSEGPVIVAALPSNQKPRPAPPLALENIRSALGQPGTFVVDPAARMLIVLPFSGSEPLERAHTATLLSIQSSRNIVIRSVRFEKALGNALVIKGGQNIGLENCYVGLAGGDGILVSGGTQVRIARSIIQDIGENAIQLFGGNRTTLSPSRHEITGTVIRRFGQLGRDYKAGIRAEGVGIAINGNSIGKGFASGIIVGGNDIRVSDNEVFDVLADSDDAGAIYMGRDWTQQGIVVVGNYIHDVGYGRGRKMVAGIYLDDMFSGATVESNVIQRVNLGILVGGGRDNVVRGNVAINAEIGAIALDSRGTKPGFEWLRAEIRKRYGQMPVTSAAWAAHYPRLKDYLASPTPFAPLGSVVERNLAINSEVFTSYTDMGYVSAPGTNRAREIWADDLISILREVAKEGDAEIGADPLRLERVVLPRTSGSALIFAPLLAD